MEEVQHLLNFCLDEFSIYTSNKKNNRLKSECLRKCVTFGYIVSVQQVTDRGWGKNLI